MPLRRRALLVRLGVTGLLGRGVMAGPIAGSAIAAAPWSAAAAPTRPRYLSAATGYDGEHRFAVVNTDGATLSTHLVPDRGHAAAVSPDRRIAVLCARRPGRFIQVIDLASGTVTRQVDAAEGRHFYGHAVFSHDGTRLLATENAYRSGDGKVGLYDVAGGFVRLGEWPTHGIGPHELALMPDGDTLVVANGGILTHPDRGREKLNLDRMSPSVVLIDTRNGTLVEQVALPPTLHQLSTRHLAVGPHGQIAVVMQYQGPADDLPPLVGVIDWLGRGRNRLRLLSAPEPIQRRMANYCGSVAFDSSGEVFGVSSPRGDLFTFWNRDGAVIASAAVADGCGLAPIGPAGAFVLSSGLGGLWRFDVGRHVLERLPGPGGMPLQWDNHLTAIQS